MGASRLVGAVFAGLLAGCGSSSAGERAAAGANSLSPAPAPTTETPGEALRLRVMTFNVNFGVGHDLPNADVIEDIDADIVLLQETTDAVEALMRDQLADRYPHMLFEECCRAGGLGLMSKLPILDEAYIEPTVGWFPAWRVTLQTERGPLQTLNVHLRPPMSDGGSWLAGYFSTRKVRRDEIAGFFSALGPAVPTIVAGDFNEDADGLAVQYLNDAGLRSALPQVDRRAKTWQWQTRVGPIRAQLDHVVHSRELRLVSARVVERGTSDHFPVVVELDLK